jgi:predicted ArsR family transcriptional regulator
LLSSVFNVAREEAVSNSDKDLSQEPAALRRLDPRARRVLGLFLKKERIISADVAGILGISKRMARVLLKRWTEDGWLKVADPSRKGRSYILSSIYRQFIGNI